MSNADEGWSKAKSDEVADLFDQLIQLEPTSDGHREIRDQLVTLHLPLLRYLARRFTGRTESFEDLVQVGSVGLLKAIDNFDPSLGHQFATYASPTIVGEIKRYMRDTGWLLRVPRRAQELQARVLRARDDLSQTTGRSPTLSEIAEEVGATPDEVAETLDISRAQGGVPLEAATGDGEQFVRDDLLAEEERGFEQVLDRAMLAEAMATLVPQEREVVRLRFGYGKTQTEIAEIIGTSQVQVSRILTRSMAKMQEALRAKS